MQQYLLNKYFSFKKSEYIDLKTDKASSSTDLIDVNTYSDDNNNN